MRKLVEYAVLLAMAIIVSGCQTPAPSSDPMQTGHDILPVPDKMLSAQQLAQRLGLSVEENTISMVALRNASNRVLLFPDAGGLATVNGKPVGPRGSFVQVRNVLFVPEAMEGDLRSALKPLPGPATPAPASQPLTATAPTPSARTYRIVVDPGHGGEDPGTISGSWLKEKNVTLAVAEELARLLKQDGFAVALTRESDAFVDLDDRAAFANHFAADLFVSLHADSYLDPSVRGFAVYTCQEATPESRAAAKAVAEALGKAGLVGLGVRQANYRVLVCTQSPAGVLVELGYLSNRGDAKMLDSSVIQTRLARSIADGIAEYFKR